MKNLLASAIIAAAAVLGLGLASTASADTNSYGSVGNDNLGGSLGMDGFSVSVGGTTLTSQGWPESHTTIVGPAGSYDATTDYGTDEIEHHSTFTSPTVTFSTQGEIYYNGQWSTLSTLTANGMTVTCVNGVCHMG